MPRIADVLERESRTVDLEQNDFERLLARRERKERNRRIRAGALGVIVALATAAILLRPIASERVPADQPTPAPPVASGALLYAAGDIYIADPDGTNAVAITDVDALDDECPGDVAYGLPSWSPDGRYISSLLSSGCSGVGPIVPGTDGPVAGVVITDLQGNIVANFPAYGREIAWSPDATRVAVWDAYSPGAFTIGIYGIDGTRETQIALPPGWKPADLGELSWTPDGASLIVDQLEVPLDGGTPRELPFPSFPVVYSPDGSQVLYRTPRALMVARPDGSEPREVLWDAPYDRHHQQLAHSTSAIRQHTWSPTGELIAVTADAPGDPWASNELYVVDVATGSNALLFEGERRTILRVIGFSPAGDRILFASYERPRSGGSLWSIGVDGSDAHRVGPEGMDLGAWRPI